MTNFKLPDEVKRFMAKFAKANFWHLLEHEKILVENFKENKVFQREVYNEK